jgi:hypothetical protein
VGDDERRRRAPTTSAIANAAKTAPFPSPRKRKVP